MKTLLHASRANLLFDSGKSTPSAIKATMSNNAETMIVAQLNSGRGAFGVFLNIVTEIPAMTLSTAIH